MDKTPSHSSGEPEKHHELVASSNHYDSSLSEPDYTLEKVVWRKLDLWILPVVTMFYFLSFLVSSVLFSRKVAGPLQFSADRIAQISPMRGLLVYKQT